MCDTLGKEDSFLEWVEILRAGTTIKIKANSFLDLKHITPKSLCTRCDNKSVTQVIFEWVYTNDSEDQAQGR